MSASLSLALPETVVVTGAASGLGHEFCRLLLDCGVRVIGVDLAQAQPDLAERDGYVHVAGDVAGAETWSKVGDAIDAGKAGSLGLVTSAAILDVGSVLEATPAIVDRAMKVNVLGTVLAFQAVLPRMIAPGRRRDRRRGERERHARRAAARYLQRVEVSGSATRSDGGHGSCPQWRAGECSEPRPDARGPLQASSRVRQRR